MQKSLEHAESGAARMSKNGPGKCGNLAGYSKRVHQGLDWQCAAAFCIERCSRLGAGRFQSRNTENADTGVGGRSACECERAVLGVIICRNFFCNFVEFSFTGDAGDGQETALPRRDRR